MSSVRRFSKSFLALFFILFGLEEPSEAVSKEKGKDFYYLDKDGAREPFGEQRYIFIRLYDPSYASPIYVENLLQNGMSKTQVNPESVSHASIGFDLSDYFFGLTSGGKYNLKIEKCMDVASNRYMKRCNPMRSTQSVYALKVKPEEYEKACDIVYRNLTNKWLRYATIQNVKIAGYSIKRKFFTDEEQQTLGSSALSDRFYTFKKFLRSFFETPYSERKFVCSGFVAWVLYNSVDSIREWFDMNKINVNYVIPSDLPHIEGVEFLFSSTWDDYDCAAKEFVRQNPKFRPYLPSPDQSQNQ